MSTETKSYTIDYQNQMNDGILDAGSVSEFFREKVKVNNSKVVAQREIKYKDENGVMTITFEEGHLNKRKVKLYLKRFLRSKSLLEYAKVVGDGDENIKINYINTVEGEDVEQVQ